MPAFQFRGKLKPLKALIAKEIIDAGFSRKSSR
jgi:hypothetical protein